MQQQINEFYLEFNDYIDQRKLKDIKEKYYYLYSILNHKIFKKRIERKFIKNYKYLNKFVDRVNKKYISDQINNNIFNNINGCQLDVNQRKAIITDEINNLIIAGAGSGKSLTIVGKIKYLIYEKNIDAKDILCISFTNDACNSLKKKVEKNIEVLTFHKLALKILSNEHFQITDITLEYVVDEYFNCVIYNNEFMIKIVLKILQINTNVDGYNDILNSSKIRVLKHNIISFINFFKANDYSIIKLVEIDNRKIHNILCLIVDIYFLYEQNMKSQNEIDFNDMINLATLHIKQKKCNLKYKYIIVDEYQDTSFTRYKLIKALIDKTNAKLIAVGDDFQSIYKFTGCDLNIFLKFSEYFEFTKKLYITNTYRNCQELINIAGKFVMKNKNQIKKELKSSKRRCKPIKIIYEKDRILEITLKYLSSIGIHNVMILSRNNNDINKYLGDSLILKQNSIIYKGNLNMNIQYMTVHKSKGLECECVIIINLRDNILGFPSKIPKPQIIELLSKKDNYLYEEERRLFYVALTRTLTDVYLIIPNKDYSIFIKEIINDNKGSIDYLNL